MTNYRELAAILDDVYGVPALRASTATVSWARDRLVDQIGENAARRQVSALNAERNRRGFPLAYV